VIGLSPSSSYYRPVSRAKRPTDAEIRSRLESLAVKFPGYGYRRMTAQLHAEGVRINHKRVLRIMREAGLLCKRKRRTVRTTDSAHELAVYPNLYRGVAPTGPNRVWVADITYVGLADGTWTYLAAILDAWSRKVVGWELGERLTGDLTIGALDRALAGRQPRAGCIHHSDRGVQYAAGAYTERLTETGFCISMSRAGNPYDNAKAESFFKTLKVEEVYLNEYWSVRDVRRGIGRFIDEVYNTERLHSALGYASPEQFERAFTHAHKAELSPSNSPA
jgi:putative transposase